MKFSTILISALACILPRSSLGARVLKGSGDGMGMGMGMSMGMGSDWAVSCPANIVTVPDVDNVNVNDNVDGMYYICTNTIEITGQIALNADDLPGSFVYVSLTHNPNLKPPTLTPSLSPSHSRFHCTGVWKAGRTTRLASSPASSV